MYVPQDDKTIYKTVVAKYNERSKPLGLHNL